MNIKLWDCELATNAMNELLKFTQIDNPLWFRSMDGSCEALNFEEYTRTITPYIDTKPGMRTEGTRAIGMSTINSATFVEMMMEAETLRIHHGIQGDAADEKGVICKSDVDVVIHHGIQGDVADGEDVICKSVCNLYLMRLSNK
ncbi:hypothetical protein POM88_039778 [Heracleum sosnowskyi]|uniref:Uncharacterized protein n=1 Tax=Heracleum sosnowskyi TaxID=360622 RepID=A0AAD8M963_9APIA|nr:hypothetical protein POM88_039778 [Heracleum sosnowskyi]